MQNFLEVGGFVRSREGLEGPDLQIQCVLAILSDPGKPLVNADGFSVHVCRLRPESRGEIGLRSADPFDDPIIRYNAYSTETDRRALIDGVRIVRQLADQPSLKAIRGPDSDLETRLRMTRRSINGSGKLRRPFFTPSAVARCVPTATRWRC